MENSGVGHIYMKLSAYRTCNTGSSGVSGLWLLGTAGATVTQKGPVDGIELGIEFRPYGGGARIR